MSEVWKVIKGYEDYYEVSDAGKIRSKDRLVKYDDKKGYFKKGRTLKAINLGKGYEGVQLCIPGEKSKKFYVHRLVAEMFLDNKNEKFKIVNHIDGNKKNNHKENLEWIDNSGNIKHAIDSGLNKMNGQDHPLSKFPKEIVFKARELYATGKYKQSELAEMFKVSRMQMHRYLKNKTKHYV